MHELSLVLNIVELAAEQTALHNGNRVDRIELEIGHLSGVEMDAFIFAWDEAIRNTVLEYSQRAIIRPKGRALCKTCSTVFDLNDLYDLCPECGQFDNDVIQGQELKVKSLTIS